MEPDINNPQYIKEAEFDTKETIDGITQAIESLGHTVYKIEADENAYEHFKNLKNKIDLVFNFAEGIYGADREAQIPAMLEMLQIPYTGPKPLSYALGLHKAKAKEIMAHYRIPTPRWTVIRSLENVPKNGVDFFPAIVKPMREGSSKGIGAENLVYNQEELQKIAEQTIKEFNQEVLVEEYLEGREFTVGILGNPARVLPIVEVTFDELPKGMPKFDHYEAKWVYDSTKEKSDPLICPAVLEENLKIKIEDVCLRAFKALEMSDWSRLDVRLDKNEAPNIIEINCPPGIIPDPKENSRFPRAARVAGMDFAKMIETVIKSACSRYKLEYKI